MSKLYLQEKIVGNPGQILTINNSNQLSLTEYKPALNSVIEVNGPVNAAIYASYEATVSIPASSVKGILKYDHEYSAKATNNISTVSLNLDTWMTTTYANNYQNVFTYTSGNWKNSSSQNVNLTNLGISYELSSGSNPTSGTTITVTVDYNKARYEIYPPNAGTWTIVCKTDTGYSETTQVVEANNTYEIDMSIFQAFIGVTYTVGATCKVINEEHGITITAPNDDGYNIFTVPYPGLWEIEVTLTAQSASTGEDFVKERHENVNITTLNQQLSRTVNVISSVLDECTWDEIKYIADQNMGPYYWNVGDCKKIELNGPLFEPLRTYVTPTKNYIWTPSANVFKHDVMYAYIIGFNHNATTEGYGITFQLGKLDENDTELSGFNWKNKQHRISSDIRTGFNRFNRTIGGNWVSNALRTVTLGSVSKEPYVNQITPPDTSAIPTGYDGTQGYLGSSIMALIPDDLRSVLKKVKKYTNNGSITWNGSLGGWHSCYYYNGNYYVNSNTYHFLVNSQSGSFNPTFYDREVYASASYGLGINMFTTFTCIYKGSGSSNTLWAFTYYTNYSYPGTIVLNSHTLSADQMKNTLGIDVGYASNINVGDSFTICNFTTDTDVNITEDYMFLPSNFEVVGDSVIPTNISRRICDFSVVDYNEFCSYQPPDYTISSTGSGFTIDLFNKSTWGINRFGSNCYTKFTYNSSQNRWEIGSGRNSGQVYNTLTSLGIQITGTPTNGSEIIVEAPKAFVPSSTDYIRVYDIDMSLWNTATYTYNNQTYYFKNSDYNLFVYRPTGTSTNDWYLQFTDNGTVVNILVNLPDIGINWESTGDGYPSSNSSKIIVIATADAGSFVLNNRQKQYDYFVNPDNRVRYYFTGGTDGDYPNFTNSQNAVEYNNIAWFTRSPSHSTGTYNSYAANGVIRDGTSLQAGSATVDDDLMLCPCFVVGSEDPAS